MRRHEVRGNLRRADGPDRVRRAHDPARPGSHLPDGAGTPDPDDDSRASWGSDDEDLGYFTLGITCRDACGEQAERRMLARWRDGAKSVKEVETATGTTVVAKDHEDHVHIVRTWRVDGDPRVRYCVPTP